MKIPSILNNIYTKPVIGNIMYQFSSFSNNDLFSDLVLKRKQELWNNGDHKIHSIDECENSILDPTTDIDEWHCCHYWHRKLSNKINAKNFAIKLGIPVPKTLWTGPDPAKIPFPKLPDSFVIKVANGWSSKQVMPILNGVNAFTNKSISFKEIQTFFSKIISTKQFSNSHILIEEFIFSDTLNTIPKDYKLYIFHEKVKAIQVIERNKKKHVWYSENWIPFQDQILLNRDYGIIETEPIYLSDMIYYGERLGREYNYPFVRVDFYNSKNGVLFGEISHTPNTGESNKLYTPFANKLFGKLWTNN